MQNDCDDYGRTTMTINTLKNNNDRHEGNNNDEPKRYNLNGVVVVAARQE